MLDKTILLKPGVLPRAEISKMLSRHNNVVLGLDHLAEEYDMEPPNGESAQTVADFLFEFIRRQAGMRTVGEIFFASRSADVYKALKIDGSEYLRDEHLLLYETAVADELVITEAEWQQQSIDNGGTVGYYSDGDGSTTFRLPTYSEEDRNWLLALDMYVQTEDTGSGGGVGSAGYELCEIYNFRHPTLKPGFMPAYGGIITDCHRRFPRAWAFLQKEENAVLCTTEKEWQKMSTAIWHTNADGTEIGWNGIGGVPYFVLDLNNKTLRLPDLRGMYAEAAGFDSLGVGGVHGDGIPPIKGERFSVYLIKESDINYQGAFSAKNMVYRNVVNLGAGMGNWEGMVQFDSSRVVSTTSKVQPRAYGVLACVYLGREVK